MRPLLSALLAVVAAAAAVSSFSALHSLARMCAFGGTAPLLPLLVDAGAPPRKRSTMKVSRTDLLAAIVARDAHQTGAMAGGPIRG